MGSAFAKPEKNYWVAWSHRPLHKDDLASTNAGTWISYIPELSSELEESVRNAGEEPVYTIRNPTYYNGDQLLLYGDLATRLGGPFVQRDKKTKCLKECRRVQVCYMFDAGNNSFHVAKAETPTKHSQLLPEVSTYALMTALAHLLTEDYSTEDISDNHQGFLPYKGGFESSEFPGAEQQFYSMFVVDHAGKDVEVVCQRVDVSLDKVDAAVAHSIKSCEGAKAALLTEECRVSMGMEMVARTLVRADAKGRYVRVEKELDQTQGIRAKLAGKK